MTTFGKMGGDRVVVFSRFLLTLLKADPAKGRIRQPTSFGGREADRLRIGSRCALFRTTRNSIKPPCSENRYEVRANSHTSASSRNRTLLTSWAWPKPLRTHGFRRRRDDWHVCRVALPIFRLAEEEGNPPAPPIDWDATVPSYSSTTNDAWILRGGTRAMTS